MHSSRYSCKIALAALLTTLAGACALKPAPPSDTAPLSSYPANIEAEVAASGAKESSRAAGHTLPQTPGLVVHIDPLTGQILPRPPLSPLDQALELQQLQSAPLPAPQHVEVASPVPGGGVKVNLNRQFHQPLFATIDGDGKIKLEHRPAHSDLGTK